MSSEDKVHLSLDFHRYKGNGDRYASGNVFYVISKKDDHWGIQLRSGGGKDAPDENREEILQYLIEPAQTTLFKSSQK